MKQLINFSIALVCLVMLWVGTVDMHGEMMYTVLEGLKKVDLDLMVESIEKVEDLDVVQNLIKGAGTVNN